MNQEPEVALRGLYPNLSAIELEDAAANLRRYLDVLVRIAERLHSEGRTIHNAGLTDPENSYTIPRERSNQVSNQQRH